MRIRFEEQLGQLNDELTAMGALCEDAIAAAVRAFLCDDDEMAQRAKEKDSEIDAKEREIEALCMKLLLQQQPVARDLRAISSALKMISDMERIGDQACDIAEITQYVKNDTHKSQTHIKSMAEAVIAMVTDSIESYVKKDLELAHKVYAADDVVDALFDKVKGEIVVMINADNRLGEYCVDLLMIAKYLERIGDHAENIAEWVEFSLTGIHRKQGVIDTV